MNNQFIKEQTAIIAYEYRDGTYYVKDYNNTLQLKSDFEELKPCFYKAYIYKAPFSNIPKLHHCKVLLEDYLNGEELGIKDTVDIKQFKEQYEELYWECDEILEKRAEREAFQEQQRKEAQEYMKREPIIIHVNMDTIKAKRKRDIAKRHEQQKKLYDIGSITWDEDDD